MKKLVLLLTVMLLSLTLLSSCFNKLDMEIDFIVDGEVYDTVRFDGKSTVGVPEDPTKAGYIFEGWYWDEGTWEKPFTANSLLDALLSSDMCVYAKWRANMEQHVHTPSDWITDTAATCSSEGAKHKECTECKRVLETEKTEKTAEHTPGDEVRINYVDSSCKASGSYNSVIYCSVCGEKLSSEVKTVEKKAHIPSGWITDTASTCKSEGERHKECTECKTVLETDTVERLTAHTPAEAVQENLVDADCETEGSYNSVVYCSICGVKLSSEAKIVEKKGHTPSGWIEDAPATCKASGSKHKECTDCKTVLETEEIKMLTTHREEKKIEIEKGLFCGESGRYSVAVSCLDCGKIISSVEHELPEKHKMSNGICEICGLPQSSTNGGMKFYLKSDGTYLVSTSSKAIDENIVIGVYNDISVTEINGGAFSERTDIKSITIADCVTTVGDLAFYNCTSIKNVVIGNGVKEIPDEAFRGCTSLRSVTLGDNTERIGYRAFKGCSNLMYVYITGAYDWQLVSELGYKRTIYGSWIAKENDNEYFCAYYLLEYVAYKWSRK